MPPSNLSAAAASRKNLRERLLAEYPGLLNDEETLNDTLAGIDEFEEQVVAVLRYAIEREAYAKALAGLIDEMGERKRRLEEGARNLRIAVIGAMQDVPVPSIRAPDMSVSIGRGKPKVQITDADALPDGLCRVTRAPDKKAIAEALAKGDVPGAALGNPQPFLIVHRR